ncbi:MAG: NAD(P)H-hydrate dehydratase, partial [Verrucomicrobiales bacterium]|nr:NAD(P)H-hydrate dehydratase [Verrucomicrobiales bacterium]
IRRVGHVVADRAAQMTRSGDLIVVLAGKGHNGDDARDASQHLHDREVDLINVTDPVVARSELLSQLSRQPSLIMDGLLGIGLNRALDASWSLLIEEINNSRVPVLAIDVPSGLNADTGQPAGVAVRAIVTLTLGAPKRGLLTTNAGAYVGRLEVAPAIGLVPCSQRSDIQWTLPEDFFGYPPVRPTAGHKGTFGHVGIIAGSPGYHGAAVLCARGALRAQPGLVTVFTLAESYIPVASQSQAAMVHTWQQGARLPDLFTVIVAGPGLANPDVPPALKTEIARLWQTSPLPMIVDASALNWLPRGATPSGSLRVITPHPGEAARMLAIQAQDVQKNRIETVRELSRRYGDCWVVLKGHQTCIGSNNGEVFVNSSGNPFLAQGGSGDVLAGYLGGQLADPSLHQDISLPLRYGVWQHGAAADSLSARRRNWGVMELLDEIGNVH